MSFIIPKKQILYAPMLGSLGGGSVRGFGRGVGGGASPLSTALRFNSNGVTGFEGPSLSHLLTGYSTTTTDEQYALLSDSSRFNLSGDGIQELQIDSDLVGTYLITAQAPQGHTYGNISGGQGGYVGGTVNLLAGDVLQILPGQRGRTTTRLGSSSGGTGGGSGGSFSAVVRGGSIMPLVIAGGGGSAGGNGNGMDSVEENTITQARGWAMISNDETRADPSGSSGGAGYRGGGGGGGGGYGSAGAGGFFTDGGDGGWDAYYPASQGGAGADSQHGSSGSQASHATGGQRVIGSRGRGFTSGAKGGGWSGGSGYNGYPNEGGFGCGGGGALGNSPGGSGGGYSGGGGLGHSNGSDNMGGRCGTTYVSGLVTQTISFSTIATNTGYIEIIRT